MDITLCKIEPSKNHSGLGTDVDYTLFRTIIIIGVILSIIIHLIFSQLILTTLILIISAYIAIHIQKKVLLGAQINSNHKNTIHLTNLATNLTTKLQKNYITSKDIIDKVLPSLHKEVQNKINITSQKFNEGAFSPFWDAIEEAIISLMEYNEELLNLNDRYLTYSKLLESENHNFINHPMEKAILLDIESLNKEILTLVSEAQKNFQFATIWEQRRTREVLIGGFNNLDDALLNINQTIKQTGQILAKTKALY